MPTRPGETVSAAVLSNLVDVLTEAVAVEVAAPVGVEAVVRGLCSRCVFDVCGFRSLCVFAVCARHLSLRGFHSN